jgi:hypothetical protein
MFIFLMDGVNTHLLDFNQYVDENAMQIWVLKELCENN